MPKYTVDFTQGAGTTIKDVEAETPEQAIELAWQEAPGSLCAGCSGYSNPPGIDLSGDWEPYSVQDEKGNVVWGEGAPKE